MKNVKIIIINRRENRKEKFFKSNIPLRPILTCLLEQYILYLLSSCFRCYGFTLNPLFEVLSKLESAEKK